MQNSFNSNRDSDSSFQEEKEYRQKNESLNNSNAHLKDSSEVNITSKNQQNSQKIKQPIAVSYPVIAILSLPSGHQKYPKEEYSYIYTSYVQYFQQSGARIVPLNWTEREEELVKIMSQVNGLVLTGGGTNLMMRKTEQAEKEFSEFSKIGLFLINLAKKKNDSGNYFPIWGTCLGFELLLLSFANEEIRNIFESKNHYAKQVFNLDFKGKSKILSDCTKSQLKYLAEEPFFYYNHKNAISKKTFLTNPKLNQNFDCVTFSKDQKEKTFVSIIEGKIYPFYGTQFHPEKLQYQHTQQGQRQITLNQIRIAQHFPNFFYSESLKSNQRFISFAEQQKYLIENHQPIYLDNYEQGMYLFKNAVYISQKDIQTTDDKD